MPYRANDGTTFDKTTCRRAGGYMVGPKGRQKRFTDFDKALAHLDSIPAFDRRWRRPNPNGNWGIVKAVA